MQHSSRTIRLSVVGLLIAGALLVVAGLWRSAEPGIPTLVVPHHDLVKKQRIELVQKHSAVNQPKTIILVSPNHFETGGGQVITTDRVWSIRAGQSQIHPNREVVNRIVGEGLASLEDGAFKGEHGVANLLGEFAEYYPASQIVPILFRETTPPEVVERLVSVIAKDCDECSVMASIDMSHYQPAHVAEIHDRKTLRTFYEQDVEQVLDVEIDSRRSLLFLMHWSRQHGLGQFELHANTNSGLMVNNFDVETTTHIMGQYLPGEPVVPTEFVRDQVTFTLAGDAMFGRKVDELYRDDHRFTGLFDHFGDRVFWGTDFKWLNLEGPVSSEVDVEQSEDVMNTEFLFSRHAVEALKYLKLTAVGLANNHALNAGTAGLEETQSVLRKAGIVPLGSPSTVSEEVSVHRVTQGDVTVAFIAAYVTGDLPELTALIAAESEAGNSVVVLPHWGVEYQTVHSAQQEQWAREWVAAGADLIVGAHPHVVQDAQVIDNALVLYSLGNFIFDQQEPVETRNGLIVTGSLSTDELRLVLTPTVNPPTLQPEIIRGEAKAQLIEHVCESIREYCTDDVITLKR